MKRVLASVLSALAGVGLTGCVAHVFSAPVTISTHAEVAKHATPVGPVAVESTDSVFVFVPVVSDPRDLYDALLAKNTAMGANAVMDVQLRDKSFFLWIFPCVLRDTTELSGTAVRVE